MNQEDTITLRVELKDLKKGNIIQGIVLIKDEVAGAKFTDKTLANRMYKQNKKAGINCEYNMITNSYIERYKGMSKEEIAKHITNELKSQGGQVFG